MYYLYIRVAVSVALSCSSSIYHIEVPNKKQARVGVLAFGLFEKDLVVFGLIVNCAVVGVVAIACF